MVVQKKPPASSFADNAALVQQQDQIHLDKEIMANAKHKTLNTRTGRKKKEIKFDQPVKTNVTLAQKKQLEEYCTQNSIAEATLVRQLLIKEGLITV